jgi:3'(2'), 5'-bisphosphate nucleotidase
MNPTEGAELVQLANEIAELARDAGVDILDVYSEHAATANSKADGSPLTLADMRAHRRIVAGLGALSPRLPILSEESAQIPFEVRRPWARYWLVDPLDGTKEFLSRNGEFTVNIALVVGHRPALGVVYAPARDTLHLGVVGVGAWRTVGGDPAHSIRAQARAHVPARVVGSRSHRGASLDAYLARLGPHELVPIGSSLKLCLIAEGSADLYPRLGPTCEWDTAAGQAIVEAADGFVVTAAGAPLEYNNKPELLNPDFLAYGDRDRDWLMPLRGLV